MVALSIFTRHENNKNNATSSQSIAAHPCLHCHWCILDRQLPKTWSSRHQGFRALHASAGKFKRADVKIWKQIGAMLRVRRDGYQSGHAESARMAGCYCELQRQKQIERVVRHDGIGIEQSPTVARSLKTWLLVTWHLSRWPPFSAVRIFAPRRRNITTLAHDSAWNATLQLRRFSNKVDIAL